MPSTVPFFISRFPCMRRAVCLSPTVHLEMAAGLECQMCSPASPAIASSRMFGAILELVGQWYRTEEVSNEGQAVKYDGLFPTL